MSKKNGLFSNILGLNNIKMGFNYTKSSLLKILESRSDTREETFKEACIRFNIVGTHDVVNPILEDRFSQYKRNFYVKLLFAIFVFSLGTYYLVFGDQFLNSIMCLLLSLTIFTFALTDSLSCYQINKRELGLAKKWIKSPKKWFPGKFENLEIDILEEEVEK